MPRNARGRTNTHRNPGVVADEIGTRVNGDCRDRARTRTDRTFPEPLIPSNEAQSRTVEENQARGGWKIEEARSMGQGERNSNARRFGDVSPVFNGPTGVNTSFAVTGITTPVELGGAAGWLG